MEERVRLLAEAVRQVRPQQFSLDRIQLLAQRAQPRRAQGRSLIGELCDDPVGQERLQRAAPALSSTARLGFARKVLAS